MTSQGTPGTVPGLEGRDKASDQGDVIRVLKTYQTPIPRARPAWYTIKVTK